MDILVLVGGGLLFVVAIIAASAIFRRKPRLATILICGATGAGKSTLINALSDQPLAAVGVGAPVTQNTVRIPAPKKGFCFYDSKGLEVEEASQTYLLLLSDILSLRYGPTPSHHIDLVAICITESQSRIDEAHREIASLCEDLQIPYCVIITKSLGDNRLLGMAKAEFGSAAFVRPVRALPQTLAGLPAPLPPEGLDGLATKLAEAAVWDPSAARIRAKHSIKTSALSSAARDLAATGGSSNRAWVTFAREASALLNPKTTNWLRTLTEMRDSVRRSLVPGFFSRVFNTQFDNTKIDGACARRLVPVILRSFSRADDSLPYEAVAKAAKEAVALLQSDRPYNSRFDF